MSVIIKGHSAFDMSIVSNIKNVESQYIKFQNIYFKCKSIEDAGGTIFVKRKKGKWIYVNGHTAINCSACYHCGWSLSFEDTVKRFNFCPSCGADMRGEQK